MNTVGVIMGFLIIIVLFALAHKESKWDGVD